ncbi:MAG: hypothetical protein KKA73_11975 [Chloroflexi bacterium]|nr:hypothetical protein [Chloroflexota bacterium]
MRRRLSCVALAMAMLVVVGALLLAGSYIGVLLVATDLGDYWRYKLFPDSFRPSPTGFSPGPNNTVYIADGTTLCFWVIDPATDWVVDRIQPPEWLFDRVARKAPGMAEWRQPELQAASGKRYRIEVEEAGKPGANFVRVDVYPPEAKQPSSSIDFGLEKRPDFAHDIVMTLASPAKLYVLITYGQVASFDEKGQLQSLPNKKSEVRFYVVDTDTDQVTHQELWPGLRGWLRIWVSPFGKVYAIGTESAEVKIINSTTDEVKTVTLSPLTMPARPWASPTPQ